MWTKARRRQSCAGILVLLALCGAGAPARASEVVALHVPATAGPCCRYGLQKLRAALPGSTIVSPTDSSPRAGVWIGTTSDGARFAEALGTLSATPESYALLSRGDGTCVVAGADEAGAMYGCLDLARRVREAGGALPAALSLHETPALALRGTCILLMKLGYYTVPITPKEFPFFYDQTLWEQYLDFLAENHFNYIAFWNGHPFDYFVKLDKYPEAQTELSPENLQRNHDTLMWLGREAEKRNIWLLFQFYNIHTSKEFAHAHGLPENGNPAPTPLLAEYTGYGIERFVAEFPSIGLYICPGEALRVRYMPDWFNHVVFPAVERTGKRPPIMFRDWFIDLPTLAKIAPNYKPLYTERKFNVEMLASDEVDPQNSVVSKLTGRHVVNIHLLGNLLPFRWSPPLYMQRCVASAIARGGATGLHLYPRRAWRWPYGGDLGMQPQLAWDRDWMWFVAWARYAWNPHRDPKSEQAYWTERLTERYGNRPAAEAILASYEESADVLPGLQRLIWLDDSAMTILSSGIMLDQIMTAPGMPFGFDQNLLRIPEYLAALASHASPQKKTPAQFIAERVAAAERAQEDALRGMQRASAHRAEALRIHADARAITLVARFYQQKLDAAVAFSLWQHDIDPNASLNRAEQAMTASIETYRELTALTSRTYDSITDIPTRTPVAGLAVPYHWKDLLPYFEKEYALFVHNARVVRKHPEILAARPAKLAPALVEPLSAGQSLAVVSTGTRVYSDRSYTFGDYLPTEFAGLPTIQFSNDAAKLGRDPVRFECKQPVRAYVAFLGVHPDWAPPTAEWTRYMSGYRVINTDADVYWREFPAGRSQIGLRKGTYVLLGFAKADGPAPSTHVSDVRTEFLQRRLEADGTAE